MRKPLIIFTIAAASVASAPTATAGNDAEVRAAATKTVRVGDAFFSPKTLKVKKGTYVKWVWGTDGASETYVEHNVRAYKGQRFNSGYKTTGSFRRRIKRTTYVVCDAHKTTMRMKIVVR